MFDARGALRCESHSPRHHGAGTGVVKADLTLGLPLSGVGCDLSWVAGKRHFSPSPGPVTPRTKAEVFQGNAAGYPLSGQGADLSLCGGKRHFAAESKLEFGAASPRRSKIEALHGLPMAGRDADITLAGGKRQFARGVHPPTTRGESAPPCPAERNQTLCDVQLLGHRSTIGRGLGSPTKVAVEKVRELRAARHRSTSPGAIAEEAVTESAPRRHRKSTGTKLNAATLDILNGSQHLKRALHQSTSTIQGDEDCESTFVGSNMSSAESLCSALVNSITSARTIQDVADSTPEGSTFRDTLRVSLKDQMETAWAILSKELDLDSGGGAGRKDARPRARRSSQGTPGGTPGAGSGSSLLAPESPAPRQVAPTVPKPGSSHQRMPSGSNKRSSESLCSFVLAPGAVAERAADASADGAAGSGVEAMISYFEGGASASSLGPAAGPLPEGSPASSSGQLPPKHQIVQP